MDKRVIEKVIEQNGQPCPTFNYENPLLDKNIADLLSKGFLKLLNKQNSNNAKHRLLLLINIRKSCKVEPPGHLYVDENLTEMLRNAYEELPDNENINRDLDSFLVRYLKEMDISSHHPPYLKPEIIQAIVNLNKNKQEVHNILLKDIIYWNGVDSKENSYLNILKSMWNVDYVNSLSKTQTDDISIKIKPLIEKILLPTALEMLNTEIIDEDDWFAENKDLKSLGTMCTVSSECFQVCCSILNTLFIKTNFDLKMHKFITRFIDSIKFKVNYISQLYPPHLQHIVTLLDIDLNDLDRETKLTYITHALEYLHSLHKECENDLIMLLSHFVKWFNLYYENNFE